MSLQTRISKAATLVYSGMVAILKFAVSVPGRLRNFALLSSAERREVYKGWWAVVKKEAHHYWVSMAVFRHNGFDSTVLLTSCLQRSITLHLSAFMAV